MADPESSGLTATQLQQGVNTTGFAPGVYTLRARVFDNGAMNAADTIRKLSNVDVETYRVNAPPVVDNQTLFTDEDIQLTFQLEGTDADDLPAVLGFTLAQPGQGVSLMQRGGQLHLLAVGESQRTRLLHVHGH